MLLACFRKTLYFLCAFGVHAVGSKFRLSKHGLCLGSVVKKIMVGDGDDGEVFNFTSSYSPTKRFRYFYLVDVFMRRSRMKTRFDKVVLNNQMFGSARNINLNDFNKSSLSENAYLFKSTIYVFFGTSF